MCMLGSHCESWLQNATSQLFSQLKLERYLSRCYKQWQSTIYGRL